MTATYRSNAMHTLLAGVFLCAMPFAAMAQESRAAPCDTAYFERLQTVRDGPFKALTDLNIKNQLGSGSGSALLSGRLSVPAPPGRQKADLAKARKLAMQVAAKRGSRSLPATASNRWVAERIRTDLTDYLTQEPSPYLCGGVANYLETLRAYSEQLSVTDKRLDTAMASLRQAIRANFAMAMQAMVPPPLPQPAPRPSSLRLAAPETQQLPAIDAAWTEEQGDAASVTRRAHEGNTQQHRISTAARRDLTPLRPVPPLALESRADLERAARRLVFAARRGGYLILPYTTSTALPGEGAATYLSVLMPELLATGAQLSDPLVASSLKVTLADIEMLDILLIAENSGADPVSAALDATMTAIENAHGDACGCNAVIARKD